MTIDHFGEINQISTLSEKELDQLTDEIIQGKIDISEDGRLSDFTREVMRLTQVIVKKLPEDFIEQLYSWKPNNLVNRTGLNNSDFTPEKSKGLFFITFSEFEKYMMDEWDDPEKLPEFSDFCMDNSLDGYRNEEGELGEQMEEFWRFFIIYFTKRFRKIRWLLGTNPSEGVDQYDFLTLEFA